MNESLLIRRRVIIAVSIFVGLFLVVTLIAFYVNRTEDMPIETISLKQETETVQPGVYGLEGLYNGPLTTTQVNRISAESKNFVDTSDLIDLTIDARSQVSTYVPSRQATEVRINAVSDSGKNYIISGFYVGANDMTITIYDAAGNEVYLQTYDIDSEG